MQKIVIISVGRLKDKFFIEAKDEYVKRLGGYCQIEMIDIPQEVLLSHPSQKEISNALELEADKIISKIPKNSLIIPLCIEGKQYSSEEFSKVISHNADFGSGSIAFVIGSSFGLSERVKELGKIKFSMSKMWGIS